MQLCISDIKAPAPSIDFEPITPSTCISGGRSPLRLTPLFGCKPEPAAITLLDETYDILSFIGWGAYGKVWSARCRRSGHMFAVKSIRKLTSSPLQEHIIMKSFCGHPNLAQLVDVFEDAHECHIVMELCEGKDLQQHVRLPRSVEEITEGVKTAIHHLHSRGVAHCDIRAENVVTSASSVKLVDLGAAVTVTTETEAALFEEDWRALKKLKKRLLAAIAKSEEADDLSTASSAEF